MRNVPESDMSRISSEDSLKANGCGEGYKGQRYQIKFCLSEF